MAPHSWILESISLAGWNSCKISRLLKNSMANWKTELKLGKVHIKRGRLQGDSLSPLHYNTITHLLWQYNKGYQFGEKERSATCSSWTTSSYTAKTRPRITGTYSPSVQWEYWHAIRNQQVHSDKDAATQAKGKQRNDVNRCASDSKCERSTAQVLTAITNYATASHCKDMHVLSSYILHSHFYFGELLFTCIYVCIKSYYITPICAV